MHSSEVMISVTDREKKMFVATQNEHSLGQPSPIRFRLAWARLPGFAGLDDHNMTTSFSPRRLGYT